MHRLLILFFCITAFGAEYYVDFDGGSDANAGTATNTAWQHLRGDVKATDTAASATFGAGDTIYFKGGVHYRGDIILPFGGSLESALTLKGDGWGEEQAIIDGSVLVASNAWTLATTQEEVAGNTNYASIYYTTLGTLPAGLANQAGMSLNVFQDGTPILPAQYPTNSNNYYQDFAGYLVAEATNSTSITDAELATLGGADLINGYVYIYSTVNNEISLKRITGYSDNTINFASVSAPHKYAVANRLGDEIFNYAGACYYDESSGVLYVWPRGGSNLVSGESIISYSTNRFGLYLNYKTNVVVDGFKIQRQTGDDTVDGTYGKEGAAVKNGHNTLVKNCEITGQYVWQETANCFFESVSNLVFYSNYVHHTLGSGRAVQFGYKTNYQILSNRFERVARTSIFGQYATNAVVSYNLITNCNGVHANGISLYAYSTNLVISYNKIYNSNIGITLSRAGGAWVVNNLVDRAENNDDNGNYCFGHWGYAGGVNYLINNTFVRSPINYALIWDASNDNADTRYVVKNNIIDGGMVMDHDSGSLTNTHNIFTGLSWQQAGYVYGQNESLVQNLDLIFANAAAGNFEPSATSVARDVGEALSSYGYPTSLNNVARGSFWDIGAYEYETAPVTPASSLGFGILTWGQRGNRVLTLDW